MHPTAAASVVLAAAGYPAPSQPGQPISGLDLFPPSPDPQAVHIFHSGTALAETPTFPGAPASAPAVVTAGGRILAVSSSAETLEAALGKIYAAIDRIHFPGMQLRRDIGHRALGQP